MEIKETCYKGTRILLGNKKRDIINKAIQTLISLGFEEISIPIIQLQNTFENKVGEENNNMMYNFTDRGNRELCLAPEYTAVIQKLSNTVFKQNTDVLVFYVQECFRGEKPQAGRYRQFTQLGVEIINPKNLDFKYVKTVCENVFYSIFDLQEYQQLFTLNENVKRGLDYYKNGQGFEITCNELGSSKQVCGGGEYEGGIGFAIGIDRILNLIK